MLMKRPVSSESSESSQSYQSIQDVEVKSPQLPRNQLRPKPSLQPTIASSQRASIATGSSRLQKKPGSRSETETSDERPVNSQMLIREELRKAHPDVFRSVVKRDKKSQHQPKSVAI